MEVVIGIVLALHIIGVAALLGGFFAQLRSLRPGEARITPGMLHGAWTMLATGLALVGLNQADDQEVDNAKIAVKSAVLLVILALTYVNRDAARVPSPVIGTVGALTTANIFIATVW